jgi:hypothetical protein
VSGEVRVPEDPQTAWTGVYCLRDYNPYKFGGSRSTSFVKATDGRLLDFKEGRDHAIRAETDELRRGLEELNLPRGTVLVVVPGHEARDSNEGRPLALAAHALALADDRYAACVDALVRCRTIPKLATGGVRSVHQQRQSMSVRNPSSLKGATVLVLDDTVTTGNSLTAARQLLREAGAGRVAAVGLGRTVKYF